MSEQLSLFPELRPFRERRRDEIAELWANTVLTAEEIAEKVCLAGGGGCSTISDSYVVLAIRGPGAVLLVFARSRESLSSVRSRILRLCSVLRLLFESSLKACESTCRPQVNHVVQGG